MRQPSRFIGKAETGGIPFSFCIFSLMSAKKRILNILFWSVVSSAFIGPGTITTAAKSGASFGTDLLWALVFSTLACLLLQEVVLETKRIQHIW